MSREIPEVLDWVNERARCTPAIIFETLRSQVENDIKARNLIGPQHGFPKRNFELQADENWFAVIQKRFPERPKGVFFHLTLGGIKTRNAETSSDLLEASLTLSDEGKCRLKVDDKEYNLWQFRKLVLHYLFFVDQEILLP
jgi:hypothetical protein